jgi:hypothetical protein
MIVVDWWSHSTRINHDHGNQYFGWSLTGVLANLAAASFAPLVQVIRHGLQKIEYQPHFIEGCLAGTGLTLDPGDTLPDIIN